MISRRTTVSAAALLLASASAAMAFSATSTTSLNVRSGPGTGFGVVDVLQPGQTVEVVDRNGGWYQLAAGGWASGNYLDAQGSAAVEVERYAVVDYPRSYGAPLFYYGSDPFFWDDAGYYWYWRGGRRHRVGWDWFDDHDRGDFRWTSNRHRGEFDRRWRDRDGDRIVRRDRGDDDDRRMGDDNDRRIGRMGDDDDGRRFGRDDDDRRIGRMGDDDGGGMGDGQRREWNERQGLRAEAEGGAEIRSGRASSNVEAGSNTRIRRGEGEAGARGRVEGGARSEGGRRLEEDLPGGGY